LCCRSWFMDLYHLGAGVVPVARSGEGVDPPSSHLCRSGRRKPKPGRGWDRRGIGSQARAGCARARSRTDARGSLQVSRRVTESTSAKLSQQGALSPCVQRSWAQVETQSNEISCGSVRMQVELDEYGCIEIERLPRGRRLQDDGDIWIPTPCSCSVAARRRGVARRSLAARSVSSLGSVSHHHRVTHWGNTLGKHTGEAHWGNTLGKHTGEAHWGKRTGARSRGQPHWA